MQSSMSRAGTKMQIFFNYDKQGAVRDIEEVFKPAAATAKRLNLELNDLFSERVENLSRYCAKEDVFIVFVDDAVSIDLPNKRSDLRRKN